MRLVLSQHTAQTAEPISLTEAKLHLRLATDATGAALYTAEDALLTAIISAARAVAEAEQWRALVLQGFDLFLDDWPCGNEIKMPSPPLRSVESIQYRDSAGDLNTFPTTDYEVDVDSTPGRVMLGYQKSWPSVTLSPKNPIRIRFWSGYVVPFTANATTDVLTAANHPFVDGDKVRLSVSGGTLPAGLAVMTDFYARDVVAGVSLKLALTAGGTAIDLTTAGTGNMFLGELPATTIQAMKLIVTDLYEERGDTVTGNTVAIATLPRGASHLLAMDSAREF
jgi:uncharacterized phiE125 gp8 family phage protein